DYPLTHVQTITVEPAPAPAFVTLPVDETIECNEAAGYVAALTALAYTNGETDACEISGTVQPMIVEDWDECGGTITITWDTVVVCDYPLTHVQTRSEERRVGKACGSLGVAEDEKKREAAG